MEATKKYLSTQTEPAELKRATAAQPLTDGAICEFDAIISTKAQDRDGDVLDPAGATVDPAAPLLWQHDASKPIGKTLRSRKTPDNVAGSFAICDTPLGRDAAKLLEFGALRISHGFQPEEFKPIKDGRYHVSRWSVMEVSLVSIPANPGAIVTQIRKAAFESPEIQAFAKSLETPEQITGEQPKAPPVESTAAGAAAVITKSQDKEVPAMKVADITSAGTTVETKSNPTVRPESAKYKTVQFSAKHAKSGQPVFHRGREVQTTSELTHAKIGAYARWKALRDGQSIRPLADNEKALLQEMFAEDTWCGQIGNGWSDSCKMSEHFDTKALLNDSTSGGQYLIPTDFDTAIIQFPLLHGELMPLVDMRECARDVIEGASLGNPQILWSNQAEGTAWATFTTTALAAQLSTTMMPVAVAVEIGRDFLSDSPVDVGQLLEQNIGQAMAASLDNQIANGDGTTEPLGIFNTSGATTVTSAMGTGAPMSLGDLEALIFSMAKQYRQMPWNPTIVCNDATYRRARGIPTGTDNATRLLGQDYQSYQAMGYPVRIQNDIPDGYAAFVAMKKYRLFRRQGLETRFSDQGQTLMLKNTAIIMVRGRFGGRIVDANAVAKSSTFQAVG